MRFDSNYFEILRCRSKLRLNQFIYLSTLEKTTYSALTIENESVVQWSSFVVRALTSLSRRCQQNRFYSRSRNELSLRFRLSRVRFEHSSKNRWVFWCMIKSSFAMSRLECFLFETCQKSRMKKLSYTTMRFCSISTSSIDWRDDARVIEARVRIKMRSRRVWRWFEYKWSTEFVISYFVELKYEMRSELTQRFFLASVFIVCFKRLIFVIIVTSRSSISSISVSNESSSYSRGAHAELYDAEL
jgi:hypothetical protein